MRKASLEELKGQIAQGQYAVDSGALAGTILADFALVRRIRRQLMGPESRGPGKRSDRRRAARPLLLRRLRIR